MFIIFSNSRTGVATRLKINEKLLEKTNQMIHIGVSIIQDITWKKHISEICKKAYPLIKITSRLKYSGLPKEDLIEI